MHLPIVQPPSPPHDGALGDGRRPDGPTEATPSAPSAAELVEWAYERFAERRLVATTGFGMEGCVLVDLIARLGRPTTIHYIDTGFLFAETHDLRARLEAKYPHVRFERRSTALDPAAQAAAHGEALWARDPDLCCWLRKVEPMRELMQGADAWITAVRREQSALRSETEPVEWDWQWQVVKIAPLAAWSREQVWEHVRRHDVPFNVLHERGYPSIGCTHCTRPVEGARPEQYTRAGRWAGSAKTECGLHARALPATAAGEHPKEGPRR